MKRAVLVACIIGGIVLACVVSSLRISAIRKEFKARADTISTLAEEKRRDELLTELDDFSAFWHEKSHILVHYTRHSLIDDISKNVPRLQVFAEHEEYAEFMAELYSIAWQVESIWETERISWDNFM